MMTRNVDLSGKKAEIQSCSQYDEETENDLLGIHIARIAPAMPFSTGLLVTRSRTKAVLGSSYIDRMKS